MRYLSIEPLFSNPDQLCRINVGCDQVRSTIQIFPERDMIEDVVRALEMETVSEETPTGFDEARYMEWGFALSWILSVMPDPGPGKTLRSRTWDCTQPGVNSHSEIRISLKPEEARELAEELRKWLRHRSCCIDWYEL